MSFELSIVEKFISAAETIGSLHELHMLLDDCTKALGFEYYSYVTGNTLGEDVTRTSNPIVIGNYASEWLERYTRRSYQYVDAVLATGMRSNRSFTWGGRSFTNSQPKRYRGMMNELRDFGVTRGATFPCHGLTGDNSFLSVSLDDRKTCFEGILRTSSKQLNLLSYLTHDICIEKFVSPGLRTINELSRREREVLLWAGDGKTSLETSIIIGCAESTVRFHLNNAAEKLGTSRKIATVTKAMQLNLL